ncbi:MAG: DUF3084 domain-containing protein [bacterium]
MESGVIVIPLLIIISGAVAYVGNLMGRATGRRRLTIFGLRPRYTAQIVTMITGMLIAIITFATVLLVSRDARTGLFRLNELREQINTAEGRLREVKGGDIAFLSNQEVVRDVIDGRRPQAEILRLLDALRIRAVDVAVAGGITPDLVTGGVLSLFPPNLSWEAIGRLVGGRQGETIVRVVALENTLRGESLRVFVQLVDRRVVYRKGAVLGKGPIDGRAGREQVSRDLFALVDSVTEGAHARLLSRPFSRITDPPLVQIDAEELRRAVTALVARRRGTEVSVIVQRETTTESPLVVAFALGP